MACHFLKYLFLILYQSHWPSSELESAVSSVFLAQSMDNEFSSLSVWWDLPEGLSSRSGVFFLGRFLTTNLISIPDQEPLGLPIPC